MSATVATAVAPPPGMFPKVESPMLKQFLRTYRVTILVSLAAVLAWSIPTLSNWMELDFQLVANRQWWRIWTGHLTHYGSSHLFWDLLMFVVLGAACERQHPRQFLTALVVMMAGIAAITGFRCDEIQVYRGLSGIDTGLFVWLVVDQCRRSWMDRDRLIALAWLSTVVGLIGKLTFEATTGQTLFVDTSTFTPIVESHLAGAALGLGCGVSGIKANKHLLYGARNDCNP